MALHLSFPLPQHYISHLPSFQPSNHASSLDYRSLDWSRVSGPLDKGYAGNLTNV